MSEKAPGVTYKAEIIKWLESIPDDEPLFLLRARDELAPETVLGYAEAALKARVLERKLSSMFATKEAMEEWQVANGKAMPG